MILARYLIRELYSCLMAILVLLMVILITNQFVWYLQSAASGLYTFTSVIKIMSLQVPLLLGYLLPMAYYLSVLVVLGRWYLNSEWVVMAANGYSQRRLLSVVMGVGVVVTALVLVLMMWVVPRVEQLRANVIADATSHMSVQKVMAKQFMVLPHHAVFRVNRVDKFNNTMQQVFYLQQKQPVGNAPQQTNIVVAKTAEQRYEPQYGATFLVFKQGIRYQFSSDLSKVKVMHFDRYGVRSSSHGHPKNIWPENALSSVLWHLAAHNARAAAEWHWRLALPIMALILSLLAFPLSRLSPRRGKFWTLIPGVLLFVIYADLIFVGRDWLKQGRLTNSEGLWWVHAAFLVLALLIFIWREGLGRRWWKSWRQRGR